MELVGRVVTKQFRGSEVLNGVVQSYDPSTGFYKIVYPDGSFEELNLSEAASLVQPALEKAKIAKKRGRKPKKRRRTRDDPGKGFGKLVDNHVQSSDDSAAEFNLGRNLHDVISVNVDLNKVNGGLDFNLNEGLSLDVGSLDNVISQQNSCFRASIDLNLSAVNDVDEVIGSGDKDGKVEKIERRFDLNLDLDDDNVESETEQGEQLMDVSSKLVESKDLTPQAAVSVHLNGILDKGVSAAHCLVGEDPCLGSVVGDLDEKEDVRGNSSDVTDAICVNTDASKFQLKPDMATPVTCKNETDDRRKRRKLIGRLQSSAEGSLRRSARRAKALAFSQINETNTEVTCAVNDVSSPGISVVSEEKPDLPDSKGVEESKMVDLPVQLEVELPPPSRNLNLEGIPVLDLFSVYTCLRSFSNLLYLSPFRLEDFVDALKSKVANTLLDSVHVAILQTLRKHLEFLSKDGLESASICLRDLNWDLLDVVTWPIFLAEYLLIYSSGQKSCFSIGILKLVDGDYYNQPAGIKISILQCLCDDVIEVECIKTELDRRISASDFGADFDKNFNNGNFRKMRAPLDSVKDTLLAEEAADTVDWNSDECCLCKMEGNLICCDGCPAAYHSRCVGVASSLLPEGQWFCPECDNNGHNAEIKPQKLIRGAELLGADSNGRNFLYCCGYLLVSESCDAESSFNYYHKDDISTVIHSLESSGLPYGYITRAISKYFRVHAVRDPSVLIVSSICEPAEVSVPSNNGVLKAEEGNQRNTEGLGTPVASSEGLAEVLEGCGAKRRKRGRPPGSHRKSSATKAPDVEVSLVRIDTSYVNHYSFARVASSIGEEIAHKPSGKVNGTLIKSVEEIVSTQLKTISRKSTKFCWPCAQSICAEMQNEKCGWCYSCKFPDEERDCLFNINTNSSISEDLKAEVDFVQSKQNKKGHLLDVTCYILSMECRMRGLLLGPWLRPDDSQLFLRNVLKASDIASVKRRLLLLESNLRPSALSADWGKHVDSAVSVGSASHVVISTRASSKFGIGDRRRNRFGGFDPTPANANGGLLMFWWRGGQASRKLFNWKVLPRSLALKVARKGGSMKIPELFYPDSSEHVKRSKQVAWRAAVEMCTSVPKLALQVRELDLNTRWAEIENTHILSTLDKESQKSIKLFKKVIVRRKCVEGTMVKYLLDFGKRRLIPDVVQKHGSKIDDPTSERKKYWLEESQLPLYLLRNFEEKRLVRKAGKKPSSKVLHGATLVKERLERKGLEYLFARAERSNYYQCAHCMKDVPISEAVSCKFCKENFHKRHIRKSPVAVGKKCTYTCHKCHSGKHTLIIKKKGKVKLQKTQHKNGIKSGNLTAKVKSKRGRKPKAYHDQKKLLEENKRVQVREHRIPPLTETNAYAGVTLRRSARKAKCAPLQYNDIVEGGKSQKQMKSSDGKTATKQQPSCQKKRTAPLSSFWKNGLQLSRKPDDGRAAEFKRRKLLIPSKSSSQTFDQPKCNLCGEEGHMPALKYIACDSCGDWYHGDAFELDTETIKNLIGFRCHVCLKRTPPACPYVEDSLRLGSLSGQAASNAGTEVAQISEVILDAKDKNSIQNCASDKDYHDQASNVEFELRMECEHISASEGPLIDTPAEECKDELVCEPIQPDVEVKETEDAVMSDASLKVVGIIECVGVDFSTVGVKEMDDAVMSDANLKVVGINEYVGEDLSTVAVELGGEPALEVQETKDTDVSGRSDVDVQVAKDAGLCNPVNLISALDNGGNSQVKEVTETVKTHNQELTSFADVRDKPKLEEDTDKV